MENTKTDKEQKMQISPSHKNNSPRSFVMYFGGHFFYANKYVFLKFGVMMVAHCECTKCH